MKSVILKSKLNNNNKFEIINDLRSIPVIKASRRLDNPYICALPKLDQLKGKTYFYYKYKINLDEMKCSCEASEERNAKYKEMRDIRKLCGHIYKKLIALKNEGQIEFDNLTWLLLENQFKYGAESIFNYSINHKDVLFGFNENTNDAWINVYYEVENTQNVFFCYGFNTLEKRWKRNLKPAIYCDIENFLASAII